MSHVLGLVIKSIHKNYHSLCNEHRIPAKISWHGSGTGNEISALKRYEWADFAAYLGGITHDLRASGLSPLDFQKGLIPILFTKVFSTRFARKKLSPKLVLKAIDTWVGPFMFRSTESLIDNSEAQAPTLEIALLESRQSSQEFFEHCEAGLVTTLRTLGFDDFEVRKLVMNGRRCVLSLRLASLESSTAFVPTDLQTKADIRSFVDDLIQEISKIGQDNVYNLEEWLEFVEHINQVLFRLIDAAGPYRDALMVVSSLVQLSAHHQKDRSRSLSYLHRAHAGCQELDRLLGGICLQATDIASTSH